jgi:hypothetical protein
VGNRGTTVIKTLVPFSFVTPPKTPPHKSLSQRTFGALKQELFCSRSKLHRLSKNFFEVSGRHQKSLAKLAWENKNKKTKKTKS